MRLFFGYPFEALSLKTLHRNDDLGAFAYAWESLLTSSAIGFSRREEESCVTLHENQTRVTFLVFTLLGSFLREKVASSERVCCEWVSGS